MTEVVSPGGTGGSGRAAADVAGMAAGRAATPAALPPQWRNRRVCVPNDLYVAARTNEIGIVVHTVGPFLGEADAMAHVEHDFEGQGYAVPLELAFRSLPRPARRQPPST